MPEAAGDRAADRSLTWSLERAQATAGDEPSAPRRTRRLPAQLYGVMAATSFTTWGILAGGYQLLF